MKETLFGRCGQLTGRKLPEKVPFQRVIGARRRRQRTHRPAVTHPATQRLTILPKPKHPSAMRMVGTSKGPGMAQNQAHLSSASVSSLGPETPRAQMRRLLELIRALPIQGRRLIVVISIDCPTSFTWTVIATSPRTMDTNIKNRPYVTMNLAGPVPQSTRITAHLHPSSTARGARLVQSTITSICLQRPLWTILATRDPHLATNTIIAAIQTSQSHGSVPKRSSKSRLSSTEGRMDRHGSRSALSVVFPIPSLRDITGTHCHLQHPMTAGTLMPPGHLAANSLRLHRCTGNRTVRLTKERIPAHLRDLLPSRPPLKAMTHATLPTRPRGTSSPRPHRHGTTRLTTRRSTTRGIQLGCRRLRALLYPQVQGQRDINSAHGDD